MNKIKKISVYGLLTMLLYVCALSCKKEEIAANDLSTYVAHNLSAYQEIPINTGDTVLTNLNLVITGKTSAGFPALLSKPAGSDVEIIAKIDNNPELIRIYDSLYNTHSLLPPEGLLKIAGNGKVFVKAGQNQSADSIKIELNNIENLKNGNYQYVVPIAIESTTKNTDLKSKLMFVRYVMVVSQFGVTIQGLDGGANIPLINTPDMNPNIFIQALGNRRLTKSVEVAVEKINTQEFINTYNSINNTNFLPFPENGYKLLKNSVVIPPNALLSAQSIQVQITDRSLFSVAQNYLLALSITDKNIVDLSKDKVYITLRRSNLDKINTELNGQRIDRTGWKVDALGYYKDENLIPSYILDGNHNTAWDSDGQLPQWLTLDMGKINTVKGFSIVPSYVYRADDFLQMEVFSSNDGNKWEFEGLYNGTATSAQSSAAQPDFKIVKFMNPVTARYFKFNILKTTDGKYAGMGELYGIQ